jgi:hypothetical protein
MQPPTLLQEVSPEEFHPTFVVDQQGQDFAEYAVMLR